MLTVIGWIVVVVVLLWALGGVLVVGPSNLFWLIVVVALAAFLIGPHRHRHY